MKLLIDLKLKIEFGIEIYAEEKYCTQVYIENSVNNIEIIL